MLNEIETFNEYAKNFAEHRKELVRTTLDNLEKAQTRQKNYYDKKRSLVEFKEGDYVMLATRNIPLKHAQVGNKNEKTKLVPRFIGPFKILEAVNANVMRLTLPRSMGRLHEVFNVNCLKHYAENTERFQLRSIPKESSVILDDARNELHIVEALLKQRQFNAKNEYLVKWHALPDTKQHDSLRATSSMFPISND
ncbi:hypothetical protein AaE_014172 [Aphanomyces astaci]|uniref:Tf2-1-like SH3-like domain-containing protein n=1 Tax=Aphanomyces astaci TaxID=112090 RepID=A0A6A4Z820_APHAT|nr:hypothetical protein AaE_014172 [Aphanomyces astaci]